MSGRPRRRVCQLGIMCRRPSWIVRHHLLTPAESLHQPQQPLETSRP